MQGGTLRAVIRMLNSGTPVSFRLQAGHIEVRLKFTRVRLLRLLLRAAMGQMS